MKAKKAVTLNAEVLPFYLEKLDSIVKDNNGYLALGKLTWADMYFVAVLDYINYMTKQDITANYPNLKKVVDNVLAIESIKKWVAERPQTDL